MIEKVSKKLEDTYFYFVSFSNNVYRYQSTSIGNNFKKFKI